MINRRWLDYLQPPSVGDTTQTLPRLDGLLIRYSVRCGIMVARREAGSVDYVLDSAAVVADLVSIVLASLTLPGMHLLNAIPH
jgi:hypothetical protein